MGYATKEEVNEIRKVLVAVLIILAVVVSFVFLIRPNPTLEEITGIKGLHIEPTGCETLAYACCGDPKDVYVCNPTDFEGIVTNDGLIDYEEGKKTCEESYLFWLDGIEETCKYEIRGNGYE